MPQLLSHVPQWDLLGTGWEPGLKAQRLCLAHAISRCSALNVTAASQTLMGKLRGGVYHMMAAGTPAQALRRKGLPTLLGCPCSVNSLSHVALTRLNPGEVYPLPPLLRGSFSLDSSLPCPLVHLYELLCMNCACSAPTLSFTRCSLYQDWTPSVRGETDDTHTDLMLMLITSTLIALIKCQPL